VAVMGRVIRDSCTGAKRERERERDKEGGGPNERGELF